MKCCIRLELLPLLSAIEVIDRKESIRECSVIDQHLDYYLIKPNTLIITLFSAKIFDS